MGSREEIEEIYSKFKNNEIDEEGGHIRFDKAIANLIEELGEKDIADKFRELSNYYFWYS